MLDSANEITDLEKLKFLQTKTVPRVEKAISKLKSTLQKLATMSDDEVLVANTITMDTIIQEASHFIAQVTRLYNENEGYAPDCRLCITCQYQPKMTSWLLARRSKCSDLNFYFENGLLGRNYLYFDILHANIN